MIRRRYLLFDAGCAVCHQLARAIEEAVGGKLEAVSIRERRAVKWLDRAYPAGWEHQPYLVTVDGERVRAYAGLGMALRLGWLLGPRQGWCVWSQIHQLRQTRVDHIGRRRFLVRGAAATVWAVILAATGGQLGTGQPFDVPVAEAQCGCDPPFYCAFFDSSFCYCDSCCFSYLSRWIRYRMEDCCGNFCGWGYSRSCCNCCLYA